MPLAIAAPSSVTDPVATVVAVVITGASFVPIMLTVTGSVTEAPKLSVTVMS